MSVEAKLLFGVRISVPDRPGTLGAIASALGEKNANIVTLDVIERRDGFAVDHLCIEISPWSAKDVQAHLERVPGVVIEEMRRVRSTDDILAPMETAPLIAETDPERVLDVLVDHLPVAMSAAWAAALVPAAGETQVVAASNGAPSLEKLETPWLPLEGPRRLSTAKWMPASWRTGLASAVGLGVFELGAAPLFGPTSAVLVARRAGPLWRSLELRQLGFLARIAGAVAAKAPPRLVSP